MKPAALAEIRECIAVEESDAVRRIDFVEPDMIAENPPCRRSRKEVSRVLSLLDELGKEQR